MVSPNMGKWVFHDLFLCPLIYLYGLWSITMSTDLFSCPLIYSYVP
jgi:hypothetical protein